MAQLPPQLQGGAQEPVTVQLDPKCLHSALKEFLDPPRTSDSRADFYAVYRRESGEFDRDYVKKHDEDLNTSLIFAGLFSAVSSAFITDIQSKLEPDPNEVTAIYMQHLVHSVNNSLFPTVNNSLFPTVDPNSATWTGPPPEIVTVQSILYASLAISLLAAFLAMLGKQWINRYIRNRGGSAAEKSRDRQRKLNGLKNWRFYLVIEAIPVMLQVALLLLGGALTVYIQKISPTVARVILAFTVSGAALYGLFTLVSMLFHNCPYQTLPSILLRNLTRCLAPNDLSFVRSVKYLMAFLAANLCRAPCADVDIEHAHPAATEPSTWNPGKTPGIPKARKGDVRCISWMLDSATDSDVIFCTARFAADTTLYPEIAHVLSPRVLTNHFLGCLSYGRVIPGRLEHASVIGMALASVLSIQLCAGLGGEDLQRLSDNIHNYANSVTKSEPKLLPGVGILRIVSQTPEPVRSGSFQKWDIFSNISDDLPTTDKLCLSRTVLQTVWRWRRIQRPSTTVFDLGAVDLFCKGLMANGDHTLPALKANCFLILAISLGDKVDDNHAPFTHNTDIALREAIKLCHERLLFSIREGNAGQNTLALVLSALVHLDPFQVKDTEERGFLWITEILNSSYPEDERYRLASQVVHLLGKRFDSADPDRPLNVQPTWVTPLVGFLSLYEKFHTVDSPPYPGSAAIRILSTNPGSADFCTKLLPILTLALSPTHPLQSRSSALKLFHMFMSGWFSPQMESVLDKDLDDLLQAVGDPFQSTTDLPLRDAKAVGTADREPMMAAVVLIGFASSDLWGNHLRRSNFTSCEEIMSTEEGRRTVLECMAACVWSEFLCTPSKVIAAIRRLEELQCSNTAEVVIMRARTSGVVNPLGHEAWGLIGRDAFPCYQPMKLDA